MELLKVMAVEEVKALIHREFKYSVDTEFVDIVDSVGRICSEDIKAEVNVPDFRRSTVDGYAVNSKDVFGASESMPALMELKGEVLMGMASEGDISFPGECFYVPTGGMLPEGSDSVVMVEYSDKLDERTILLNSPAAYGDNVIQVGEDVAAGDIVVKQGQRLRPYEVGVIASLGYKKVSVYKSLKIGVISTGDEIVPLEKKPELGEVRDINTYLLCSSILEDGAVPVSFGIVNDDFELLKNTLEKALKECDIVLVSGGSSVGKKDQTLKVIDSFQDGRVLVHGMSIKPGKPTIVGKAFNKIIFGLPGHPLAASVVYRVLVKDYINLLNKCEEESFGVSAEISMNYHKAKGREEYLPVAIKRVEGRVIATPVFGKSGIITAFSRAYGYVRIEKNMEGLREGEKVEVYRL